MKTGLSIGAAPVTCSTVWSPAWATTNPVLPNALVVFATAPARGAATGVGGQAGSAAREAEHPTFVIKPPAPTQSGLLDLANPKTVKLVNVAAPGSLALAGQEE